MASRSWASITCFTGVLLAGAPATAAELRIDFPDLKPQGRVAYAVYAEADAWKRRSGAVKSGTVAVGTEVVLQLPPGSYAIMAYHDQDGDQKLDTLPIGLPTEPYGFSNDARGTFGPPGWRAAVFKLREPGGRQTLRLR